MDIRALISKLEEAPDWDKYHISSLACEYVENALSKRDLVSVDLLLKEIDPTKYPVIFSTAVLRSSFRCRERLQNWFSFRDKVKDNFIAQGQRPEQTMRGLLAG